MLNTSTASISYYNCIDNIKLKIAQNKIIIIVAHRLSALINFDQIVVLNSGKIAEVGNHNELTKTNHTGVENIGAVSIRKLPNELDVPKTYSIFAPVTVPSSIGAQPLRCPVASVPNRIGAESNRCSIATVSSRIGAQSHR